MSDRCTIDLILVPTSLCVVAPVDLFSIEIGFEPPDATVIVLPQNRCTRTCFFEGASVSICTCITPEPSTYMDGLHESVFYHREVYSTASAG